MVWDTSPANELNLHDLNKLNIQFREDGRLILPRRRLFVPMPYHTQGFFELAEIIEGLAHEIRRVGKDSPRVFDKIRLAQLAVEDLEAEFRKIRDQWSEELRSINAGTEATNLKLISRSKVRMPDCIK